MNKSLDPCAQDLGTQLYNSVFAIGIFLYIFPIILATSEILTAWQVEFKSIIIATVLFYLNYLL